MDILHVPSFSMYIVETVDEEEEVETLNKLSFDRVERKWVITQQQRRDGATHIYILWWVPLQLPLAVFLCLLYTSIPLYCFEQRHARLGVTQGPFDPF